MGGLMIADGGIMMTFCDNCTPLSTINLTIMTEKTKYQTFNLMDPLSINCIKDLEISFKILPHWFILH